MNYREIEKKYIVHFKNKYEVFIDGLIVEVLNEQFPIDYSVYTSKTAYKPKQIAAQFLADNQISDHRITDEINSFSLDLSFYLEMVTHKIRVEIESKLFNEITQKNIELNR